MRAAGLQDAHASLCVTFAREVAERLPRLEAGPDIADLDAVRRDAHTLASSAWVVDEPEIARLARAVEDDLVAGPRAELVACLRSYLTRHSP
jgi:HPt (histidine-containing phosphotransfer) domain-containing protein